MPANPPLPFASWPDLVGFGQMLGAVLLLGLAGRALLRGREGPAVQMIAGWGAFCLLLSFWGVASAASLRLPAIGFCVVAACGLAIRRRHSGDFAALARILVLAVPILAITATMRPSQPDIFLNLMPNAAFLVDHAAFPTEAGAPSYSFLPVAPYNTQLVVFLGSLLGGGFAAGGLAIFTILLHLAAGLLFARIVADRSSPGWRATAFGLLLATAFDPGFVPRVSFAGYGEAPLAITLLFAASLALAVMTALARGERRPAPLLPLALTLAALINIKQQALGLFLAFLIGAVLVAAWDRRIGWRRGLRAFLPAGIPAAALYLAWRVYVSANFPEGELKPLPIAEWQWSNLPAIAVSMGKVILEKPFFFACVAAIFALLPRALRRRPDDETARAVGLAASVFLAYNAFIVLTYIGHFPGEMSVEAHSYFRYNTQLSLLIVLALVMALGGPARAWLAARSGRGLGYAAIGLVLLVPIAFAGRLRFDRDMPQPLVWGLAEDLAPHLPAEGGKIALLLPGDRGSVATMLRGILRFSPPRHPTLEILELTNGDQAALDQAADAGFDLALLSCTDGGGLDLPAHSAALLQRRDGMWRPIEISPYPPVQARQRWSQILAGAPLCRP